MPESSAFPTLLYESATPEGTKLPDDDFLADLRDKGSAKANEKGRAIRTRHETARKASLGITEALKQKEIRDYEPCALTPEQKDHLLAKINAIARHEDKDTQLRLSELYLFIKDHGAIFPEFSHGTSAGALESIMTDGLQPHNALTQTGRRKYGEGTRNSPRKKKDEEGVGTLKKISAGVGLGGLGTAEAYAQMTEVPAWNPYTPSDRYNAEYRRQLEQDDLDDAQRESIENFIKSNEEDLAWEKERTFEFPLIVGFNRSAQVESPDHPDVHWSYGYADEYNKETRQRTSYHTLEKKKDAFEYSNGSRAVLDSEMFLPNDDVVPPEEIVTLSCPESRIPRVRRLLYNLGKKDVAVISMEALALLPKLGIDRVERARKTADDTLKGNLVSQSIMASLRSYRGY